MSIKKCIKSRFENGMILEADYSQLEVIALAYLSQDSMLIQDIQHGIDLHCMSASFLTGKTYQYIKGRVEDGDTEWIKIRKQAKGPSFQLQYGAGMLSISQNCGITVEEAKKFIRNYYSRYEGVKRWQDNMIEEAKLKRHTTNERTSKGKPAGKAVLQSVTGRAYTFIETDSPDFIQTPTGTSFSPTQLKNYPVQGLATGDIVPMMVGILYEKFDSSDCRIINTVHDSILFDVNEDGTDFVKFKAKVIKAEMEKAPEYFNARFNPDVLFTLPLKANVTWGPSWGEQIYSLDKEAV